MIIGVVIILVKVMLSFTERIICLDELKRSTLVAYNDHEEEFKTLSN